MMTLTSVTAACITPEPPRRPEPSVDATELFRRARFKDLSKVSRESFGQVIDRLRPKSMSASDETLDFAARTAYRAGDGEGALEALQTMSPTSRTRAILSALLENVNVTRPLNRAEMVELGGGSALATIPLDPVALAAGYAIVSARIGDKDARLLWDTGATENVISDGLRTTLKLPSRHVQFTLNRGADALVVRFDATALRAIDVGPLRFTNLTAVVTELHTVQERDSRSMTVDGFLSPQLLLRQGCFEVDRRNALLKVGLDPKACRSLTRSIRAKEPIFTWDGEVYVNARVHESADLSLQLETGSPITYLRADASRYVPKGVLESAPDAREGEIAHHLKSTVLFSMAGRTKSVSAIDLEPRRQTDGHDDIGTVGTDILLDGAGFVVSFATMELAFLTDDSASGPQAALDPLP